MSEKGKWRFYWRAFVSFYVVASFLIISLSGMVLYIAPPGRIANWSYWTLGSLQKANWQAVHTIFAFLFVVAAAFHVYFNWRVLVAYVKSKLQLGVKRKWELVSALGLSVSILALTIAGVPPFSTVMDVGEDLKNSWATPANEPPLPHAEELTLARLSETTAIPLERMIQRLKREGVEPLSDQATIGELADKRGVTPQELFDKLKGEDQPRVAVVEGGGYGRKTVQELSAQLQLPVDTVLANLRRHGIEATPDSNIRELALAASRTPIDIVKFMQGD